MSVQKLTIKETRKQLKIARKRYNALRKRIELLRKTLLDRGVNPDPPKIDLIPRNKKIYRYWKKGHTLKEVASHFKLSVDRISSICGHIDIILADKKRSSFEAYKDLVK